jgi:phosphoenolpyruvate-protein kinase (PTS system EI component)
LSTPLDAYHPAVLRMVRRIVAAAHDAGKEVSVCGEMAARFELAAALLALGVDALSVPPPAVLELKQRFAQFELAPLRRDLDRALAHGTAEELRHAIGVHTRMDD